jgi:hypothetical protein
MLLLLLYVVVTTKRGACCGLLSEWHRQMIVAEPAVYVIGPRGEEAVAADGEDDGDDGSSLSLTATVLEIGDGVGDCCS